MAENKFEQEPISAPDLIWVKPTPQTKEKGKLVPFTGKKAFMLSCYGWDVREEHVFLSNFQAEIKPCLLVQGHDSVLEQSTTCSHRSVLESPLSVWQKHPQCVTGKQELLLSRLIEYVVFLFWIREKLAINWLKQLEVKWQKLLGVKTRISNCLFRENQLLLWQSLRCP